MAPMHPPGSMTLGNMREQGIRALNVLVSTLHAVMK
jgi:hypothetical protein